MPRSKLLVAVGGALAGSGVLLAMVAVVFQPLLIFVALPIAATGYLIWYQGTGRLAARMRRQAARANAGRARERARMGDGGSREGARWADAEFREGRRRTRQRSRPGGPGAGGPFGEDRRRPPGTGDGPSVTEAYRTLGLDPGADADAVRTAYRDRVKEVHPDTDEGDEEEFKRVNRAYETLQEREL